MDAKRTSVALLVGGAVLWGTGYLIFNVLFDDFYAANAGSASGVDRDAQLLWAAALGELAYAGLIIFAIGNRTGVLSIGKGAVIGAVVGFLLWFHVDFLFYGGTNLANLTRTIVDPLLEFVHGGLGGVAIAVTLRMLPGTDRAA